MVSDLSLSVSLSVRVCVSVSPSLSQDYPCAAEWGRSEAPGANLNQRGTGLWKLLPPPRGGLFLESHGSPWDCDPGAQSSAPPPSHPLCWRSPFPVSLPTSSPCRPFHLPNKPPASEPVSQPPLGGQPTRRRIQVKFVLCARVTFTYTSKQAHKTPALFKLIKPVNNTLFSATGMGCIIPNAHTGPVAETLASTYSKGHP